MLSYQSILPFLCNKSEEINENLKEEKSFPKDMKKMFVVEG